jgi:hypothetical protein
MVKRKLKQTTGNLTVVVNVGGVPTKKVRKKRGKSRARGGGSVRPAKNFVVSYTDQTPTLNLLKEFSETNRLLLTGQNNLAPPAMLAAPARLAAQTSAPSVTASAPSVTGTAYSIDTTRLDPPRPNRLTPQSSTTTRPIDTMPPAPLPLTRQGSSTEPLSRQGSLTGFEREMFNVAEDDQLGAAVAIGTKFMEKFEDAEKKYIASEIRASSLARNMPKEKPKNAISTNTDPVIPPRPPPRMETIGVSTLPQRTPPNRSEEAELDLSRQRLITMRMAEENMALKALNETQQASITDFISKSNTTVSLLKQRQAKAAQLAKSREGSEGGKMAPVVRPPPPRLRPPLFASKQKPSAPIVNDPRAAEEPITVSPWYAKGYESTSSEEEPDLAKQVPKQVPKRTISGRMFSSAKKMLSRKPSLTADRKAELKAQRPPPSIKKK